MNKKAFTLIELLVVVSIIIILIGLTSSGVLVAMKKAKQNRAKTEIMNILTAVKLYNSEVGIPPGKITEKCLGKPLTKNMAYGTTPDDGVPRFGPFYEFKDSGSQLTPPSSPFTAADLRVLMDPWDNYYRYVQGNDTGNGDCPPKNDPDVGAGWEAVNNGFSIVYSVGPDGIAKTKDDVGTWQ